MRRIRKWLNTELESLGASKMAVMFGPQVALAIPLTARHSPFPSLGLLITYAAIADAAALWWSIEVILAAARARDATYRKFS